MESIFITITGSSNYYGLKPYKVGRIVKLSKDPNNSYDGEAIKVELPYIGRVGYVANSPATVYAGTESAGRVYEKVGPVAYAKVRFITRSSVIAEIVEDADGDFEELSREERDDQPLWEDWQ